MHSQDILVNVLSIPSLYRIYIDLIRRPVGALIGTQVSDDNTFAHSRCAVRRQLNEMNWASIIVALIFALLHASNFATRPWLLALGQQIYAFALGMLYAYWLEKSRSVLASSVGHNVGDVVDYILLYAWIAFVH
jgi:hypothetical protein